MYFLGKVKAAHCIIPVCSAVSRFLILTEFFILSAEFLICIMRPFCWTLLVFFFFQLICSFAAQSVALAA